MKGMVGEVRQALLFSRPAAGEVQPEYRELGRSMACFPCWPRLGLLAGLTMRWGSSSRPPSVPLVLLLLIFATAPHLMASPIPPDGSLASAPRQLDHEGQPGRGDGWWPS
jgi:hypothetical protein